MQQGVSGDIKGVVSASNILHAKYSFRDILFQTTTKSIPKRLLMMLLLHIISLVIIPKLVPIRQLY